MAKGQDYVVSGELSVMEKLKIRSFQSITT